MQLAHITNRTLFAAFLLVTNVVYGADGVQSLPGNTRALSPAFARGPLLSEPPLMSRVECCGGLVDKPLLPGPSLNVGGVVQTSPVPSTSPAVQPGMRQAGIAAPADFVLFENSTLSSSATGGGDTSEVLEPSVGSAGRAVFQTGNWHASLSSNNGATWSYVNPYTMFPSTGAFSEGFCCDQRVTHDRTREMVIWYLQYVKTGDTSSDHNGVRIAIARSEADLLNNSWSYYSFTPSDFNIGLGEWMDFPHLQVTNNFLYATSNLFSAVSNTFTRCVVWRIPLSELKAGGSVNYTWWLPNTTWSDAGSIALASGTTDTMYLASLFNSTSIRIYNVSDSAGDLFSRTVGNLSTTFFGTHTSIGPDGNNWTGRADSRIHTGWARGNEVGFMWNSAAGTNRPQPFVRAVTVDRGNLTTVTGQPELWHADYAWHYPAVAVNAGGDIGGVVFVGGPTIAPMTQVLLDDEYTNGWEPHFTASGTNGGNSRWGDYLGAQPDDKNPHTWIATGYTLNGPATGGANSNIRPRFFWFGREEDSPVTNYTITVSASPGAGGAVTGGGTYPANSARTVTATPNAGYTFVNWTENGTEQSISPSYTFTLTQDRTLVANFVQGPYTIAVSASPDAGGTVTGGGTYPANSSRTVTATPNAGYTFVNWTENGAEQSISPSYTFTLTRDRTLVANFVQGPYTIALSALPGAGGTVTGGGTYPANSSRTVTATANAGYTFVNWTENGAEQSISPSYTFTLARDRILVANFAQGMYTISVSASPAAGGTVTGGGTFPANSSRSVIASANVGYLFRNWTENGVTASTSPTYTFTLTANRTLSATFHPVHPADYALSGSATTNFQMTINEVTAYGAAWKQGTAWPIAPSPIDLNYVTRAGFLWKSGEAYRYDSSVNPPLCWLPGASAGAFVRVDSGSGGVSARSFSLSGDNDRLLRVRLLVTPGSRVFSYAVEEQLPHGWGVTDIDYDGHFDSRNRLVRWGPFFDSFPRVLSYEARPDDFEARRGHFRGRASFDGVSSATEGDALAETGDPFAALRGTYYGVVETTPSRFESSGFFRLALTRGGAFTGTISIGSEKLPLQGTFDEKGSFAKIIGRNNHQSNKLDMRVRVINETGEITGEIQRFNVHSSIHAFQVPFDSRKRPAPFAGSYDLVSTQRSDELAAQNSTVSGRGRIHVTVAGDVRASLRLDGGWRGSQASGVSRDGLWPFFIHGQNRNGVVKGFMTVPAPLSTSETTVEWLYPRSHFAPPSRVFHAVESVFSLRAVRGSHSNEAR